MRKYLSLTVYGLAIVGFGFSGMIAENGSNEADATVNVIRENKPFLITIPPTTTTLLTTTTSQFPTTTIEPSSSISLETRPTIPLAEAKEKGLWGSPVFEGCTSKYGTQSPDWLPTLLKQSSWPVEAWPKLCRVIGCESNFNPQAYGGLRDRNGPRMMGLLQIDRKSWTGKWQSMGFTDMFDPLQNLEFGYWLFTTTRDNDDWNSWPGDQWTCNRA